MKLLESQKLGWPGQAPSLSLMKTVVFWARGEGGVPRGAPGVPVPSTQLAVRYPPYNSKCGAQKHVFLGSNTDVFVGSTDVVRRSR